MSHRLLPTRRLPLTLVLLLALLPPYPAYADDALTLIGDQDAPFPLYRYQLDNGLRIWFQPRPDSASVALMLMLDVGLRDERAVENGISHFVEHLLFTGSQRWSEEEIKEVIPSLGGVWNGYTNSERTAYYAQVEAQYVETALDWLVELVMRPVFTEATLAKEREVIFAEGWGRTSPLLAWLYRLGFGYDLTGAIHQQLFPGSALALSVLGEDDSLARIDLAAVQRYYAAHYRPDNMVLVVVGNVERPALEQLAQRYLADLSQSTTPRAAVAPPLMVAEHGPVHTIIRGPVLTDQVRIAAGFSTVGRTSTDYWTIELFAKVLEQRLERSLRYARGLVYSVWVDNVTFDDVGYLAIRTSAARRHRTEILQQIDAELAAMRREGITAAELTLARTAHIGQQALALEDNQARADYLAWWATTLPADAPVPDYRTALQAVTAEELAAVVGRYATPKRRFLAEHQPIVTGADLPWLAGGGVLLVAGVVTALWWRRRRLHRDATQVAAQAAAQATPASQPPST